MTNPRTLFSYAGWSPILEAVVAVVATVIMALPVDSPPRSTLLAACLALAVWCGVVLVCTVKYTVFTPGPRLTEYLTPERAGYAQRVTLNTVWACGAGSVIGIFSYEAPDLVAWVGVACVLTASLIAIRYAVISGTMASKIIADANDQVLT